MAKLAVKNWSNKTLGRLELAPAVFDYPLKEHLIYEAVCAYRAGARAGTHKIKNRSEISGGTKKLWKQKHTGRARMGDNRSPLWRHGGTVHGPVPRSYAWAMPKRMRHNALRSALSQRLRDGHVLCLERMDDLPSHKTRELERTVVAGLGLAGSVLLVGLVDERNLALAARNHPRLKFVRALGLNIVDLLDHQTLVFSAPALSRLEEVLAS